MGKSSMRLPHILVVLVLLIPASAAAQGAYCITPQVRCRVPVNRLPGAPCHCPGSATATGSVAMDGGVDFYPAPNAGADAWRELLNDDLEQGDDVLAGPRWHRRPAGRPTRSPTGSDVLRDGE